MPDDSLALTEEGKMKCITRGHAHGSMLDAYIESLPHRRYKNNVFKTEFTEEERNDMLQKMLLVKKTAMNGESAT